MTERPSSRSRWRAGAPSARRATRRRAARPRVAAAPSLRAGEIELVALLRCIEQAFPGDSCFAGDIGEPAGEIGDHRRRFERSPGEVGGDHLRERIELGAGALGVTHQVLVQDNAEVTSAVAHLFERAAAIAQQVDERNALGIEQLEREPHPLGRILDAGEGVGDVDQQVLAPAQVAALVAQRDPHLRESVLRLARALRRLGRPAGEALQRHVEVCCSTPEAFAANRSSCSASTRPRSCRRSCRSHRPPRSSSRSTRRDHRPSQRRSAHR